jgi:hypothetical protein
VVTDVTVGTDTYRVHTFANTGSENFIVSDTGSNGIVECLIVAGGGGGGRFYGAGGGAGGVIEKNVNVTNNTFVVTVGSGGIGANSSTSGQTGQNSSVFDLVALGGGGGGGNGLSGNDGGSGGGGSRNTGPGGTGRSGQGNNGATVASTSSGGGGGAGQSATAQNGGAGKISSINGTSTYYGGGGAGPILGDTTITALGGLGGGGNAQSGIVSGNGTNGLGGGGAGWTGTGTSGGTGGSGIVIVRYPLTNNVVKVESPSYISGTGSPIQTFYYRTNELSVWSAPVGVIGNRILPLGLSITPKKANSLIVMTWMINGEVHFNTNWLIYLNDQKVSHRNYEGHNNRPVNPGRWVGYVSGIYDSAGDVASTMENTFIQYSIIANTTETLTFYPAIVASGATAYTFYLNRCAVSIGDSYELGISTGVIMEIAQ